MRADCEPADWGDVEAVELAALTIADERPMLDEQVEETADEVEELGETLQGGCWCCWCPLDTPFKVEPPLPTFGTALDAWPADAASSSSRSEPASRLRGCCWCWWSRLCEPSEASIGECKSLGDPEELWWALELL